MHQVSDDRFYGELRARTAKLAEIVGSDLAHPVPTCPDWTFRQLATHVGRGHRWAAEIVATRAAEAIPFHHVPDGKLPTDPARHQGRHDAGEGRGRRTPFGVTVEPGHAKADVAVRGPAARLLLVLTGRLPPADPAIKIHGDQALLTHWIDHTPF